MLGERLRQARLEAGLSQRQLCGEEITRNMLSLIENGTATPSMHTLQYLAARLGKPVGYFLEENTVSPNQQRILLARDAYTQGDFARCKEILEDYQLPDPVFDPEWGLLQVLSRLELAAQALEQGRAPYAQTLLEQAEKIGAQTPYYTPECKRRQLVLLAQAKPREKTAIAAQLPGVDDVLLLMAEAALETGELDRAEKYLDAMKETGSGRWQYFKGEIAWKKQDYAQAVAYYTTAETAYPQLCREKLEQCYEAMGDYKMAYYYAKKQREP